MRIFAETRGDMTGRVWRYHPADVADVVQENVGTVLDVLHEAGVVHLDVTPNNILRVDGHCCVAYSWPKRPRNRSRSRAGRRPRSAL